MRVRTGWTASAFLFATVAVVLVSYYVGRHGQSEKPADGTDWELVGIIGTALGTTLLAAATGALAALTYGDVRATREIADLTRQEQRSRNKPLIRVNFAMVRFENADMSNGRIWGKVTNWGLGPAFDLRVECYYVNTRRAFPSVEPLKRPLISVVPVQDEAGFQFLFDLRPDEVDDFDPDHIRVYGSYGDLSGEFAGEFLVGVTVPRTGLHP